jgi:hypothetical protein
VVAKCTARYNTEYSAHEDYAFRTGITLSTDYFPIQHSKNVLSNGKKMCSL